MPFSCENLAFISPSLLRNDTLLARSSAASCVTQMHKFFSAALELADCLHAGGWRAAPIPGDDEPEALSSNWTVETRPDSRALSMVERRI